MAVSNYLFVVALCLSANIYLSSTETLTLDNNMQVTYQVYFGRTISFYIEAKVKGWVYIGFEEPGASFPMKDIYQAYTVHPNKGFGFDCYSPPNINPPALKNDTRQNWVILSGIETNATDDSPAITRIIATRNLTTIDQVQDIQIQNKTYNFLWAYNTNSDDMTQSPTASGSVEVNFLRYRPTNIGDGNENEDGGAAGITVGICTLAFAILSLVMSSH